MPAPLDPDKREAIEHAIRAGQHRNQIARDHDVPGSTVTKIAKALGPELDSPAFDRSQTKSATQARAVDIGARRTILAEALMSDAELLRQRMWEAQFDTVHTSDGPETIERPTNARGFQSFLTAVGIAIDKVGVLTRDETEGMAAVDAWLRTIVGS